MKASANCSPLTFYQQSFILLCIAAIISFKVFFHEGPSESCQLRERILNRLTSVFSYKGNHSHQNAHSNEARPSCIMPQTIVMPRYFKKNWRPKSLRNMCAYESRLARVENEQLVLTSSTHTNTCFMEVIRGEDDQNYTLSKCLPLNSTIPLGQQSAILITSGRSINAEVNLAVTPSVQKKLEHWKTKPADEMPISVLMFGVDTVSRAHAYRSLPKSLNAMRRLNFTNFKGHHSVASSTLSSFMAFLMGLRRNIVRITCSRNWTAPFDLCPLIWKNFSDSNYITMFMEDGDQSFNWGGQSGFTQQPTDYYWHHLFLALRTLRQRQFETQRLSSNSSQDCASNESLGEFILRTTRRFIDKFKHVPFFAFPWLAFPFHNDLFTLAGLDDPMSDFLTFLESKPELLRRTLIIFLSDHGDRSSFFNTQSSESFIERGSVPLFIRIPEALAEKHPEAFANLQANSNKFVTPFDVHHTLLHVLQKDFGAFTPVPGPPHPPDERTSLFLPLNNTRSCAKNNIPVMNCLCNIQNNEKDSDARTFLKDKKLRQHVLNFAIRKLNEIVQESKYARVCRQWKSLRNDRIIYIRNIAQTKDFLEFFFAFSALSHQGKFQSRLKLDLRRLKKRGRDVDKALHFVGIFRSNNYGKQSWCIGKATDEDKAMKEFCYCKRTKPK